jgi:hypothetical protein
VTAASMASMGGLVAAWRERTFGWSLGVAARSGLSAGDLSAVALEGRWGPCLVDERRERERDPASAAPPLVRVRLCSPPPDLAPPPKDVPPLMVVVLPPFLGADEPLPCDE